MVGGMSEEKQVTYRIEGHAGFIELNRPRALNALDLAMIDGFAEAIVEPAEARFDQSLGEFILPYDAVRTAPDPDKALLAFLQTSYDAAAILGQWDRASLECAPGRPLEARTVET